MTEHEYITATDLVKIRIMKRILMDMLPETSVVSTKEYKTVYGILTKWEKLSEKMIAINHLCAPHLCSE